MVKSVIQHNKHSTALFTYVIIKIAFPQHNGQSAIHISKPWYTYNLDQIGSG